MKYVWSCSEDKIFKKKGMWKNITSRGQSIKKGNSMYKGEFMEI